MELEFDKEIDAIMRQARMLTADAPSEKHVDADAIAAFAENALPQKAKLLYMEHFADCDRCRKMLSNAVAMNADDERSAPAIVPATVVQAVAPWYAGLFGMRNLAFGMGALVLIFSGVLGYLVLQNRDSGSATVSQAIEPATLSEPAFGGLSAANANTAVPAASPSNAAVAENPVSTNNAANNAANVASPATPGMVSKTEADGAKLAAVADDKDASVRKEFAPARDRPEAPAAPPPPPITGQTATVTGEQEKKVTAARSDEITALEKAKLDYGEDRSRSRDIPAPASKAGPSRSGPLQNQANQVQNRNFEMPVTRAVAGKTFSNRDGAWYDSTYRGQATVHYRRGTDEYKKLDSGLRRIADNVNGTVVIVWKGKAYRIYGAPRDQNPQ